MKKKLINEFLRDKTADEDVIYVLERLPDEAFAALDHISKNAEYEGADWATRELQELCRKYLSDDTELMKKIDEDN